MSQDFQPCSNNLFKYIWVYNLLIFTKNYSIINDNQGDILCILNIYRSKVVCRITPLTQVEVYLFQ